MAWVLAKGYVTYLTLNAPGADVTYDLGVGTDSVIRLVSFGAQFANLAGATPSPPVTPDPTALLFPALLIAGTLVVVVPVSLAAWRRGETTLRS